MKKFIARITAMFLIIIMSLLFQSAILLADTFNQHQLTYGVGSYGYGTQRYYIYSSASNESGLINAAMNEWKYTTSYWGITTPIWYYNTTTKSSSRMDISKTSSINNWWGLTTMYNGNQEVNPYSSSWVWGGIQLDGDFSNCPNQKGVIAHEMGHVMGLAHRPSGSSYSLMRRDIAYSSITRAQPYDLGVINFLYDDVLRSGETLVPGEYIPSRYGRFKLVYQTDGNLVLYRTRDNAALWASWTHGYSAGRTAMQTDGNLVIYDANNVARWASWTHYWPGSHLVMQTDGNLVIYDTNNVARWWTGTNGQY